MTILHLTTFLQGGAGQTIVDLAIAQRQQGHDVAVVTSRTGAPGYENYAGHLARLEAARVPVRMVDSLFVRDYAQNLAAIEVIQQVAAAMGTVDIIHSHAAIPAAAALVVAGVRRQSVALIQTMHGWGIAKTAAQSETDVRLMNLMDRVIVPAHPALDHLVGLGVDKARLAIVSYGVDDRPAEEAPLGFADAARVTEMRERRRDGDFVLCCVGTIGPRKNQAGLVDALGHAALAERLFTVFVGDGDTAGLTAHLQARRPRGLVAIHGYSNEARRMAAEADALVLPSRSEGQPLAILEAFADRVLVIASDIPELQALVRDGETGLICAVDNPASLGGAIDRARVLSADERAAIAGRARAVYEANFTLPAMVEAYGAAYRAARAPRSIGLAG